MLSLSRVSSLALLLGLAAGLPEPFSSTLPRRNESAISTLNATAFSIVYGYPLIQYAYSLSSVISDLGVNAILHENATSSAGEAAIVRPNVDTLYSKVALDLSSADVALTIPEIPEDRFYVIPFYDLWSNNFANLGPLENLTAGTYLIRPANTSSNVGFQAATGDSAYDGFINFPTTYGLVLPRILLKNNTTDPALVHEIQSGITVQEIPRKSCKNLPPLTTALLGGGTLEPLNLTEPESLSQEGINDLLGVVAAVAPYNLPIQPEEVAKVDAYLRAAGVSGGQYTPPQDVNYTAVNELIGEQLVATVDSSLELYTNSWGDTLPQYSGNFHEGYYVRSYIALTGYLQLTQDVCIYPQWFGDGAEGLSLEANQSYIMTFPSGKPPVDGFWSITGYNSSSYLIPNPIDVYAVGDRSNLTYPDGALVYGDDDRNDPFSILIQPADIIPPQNWTSNWLPAPARGGDFTVNLRFYGPTSPLGVNGSYIYPIVTKQDAITA